MKMYLFLILAVVLISSCSSDKGRYELYADGALKLDKSTGQVWGLTWDKDGSGGREFHKIKTEE